MTHGSPAGGLWMSQALAPEQLTEANTEGAGHSTTASDGSSWVFIGVA